jgi:hypothetical protein
MFESSKLTGKMFERDLEKIMPSSHRMPQGLLLYQQKNVNVDDEESKGII